MKKLIGILLALTLVFASGATVFADDKEFLDTLSPGVHELTLMLLGVTYNFTLII